MTTTQTSISMFFLFLVFLALQTRSVNSHSFLLQPRGDFKDFRKAECRIGGPPHSPGDNCRGPCIDRNSWQYDPNHKPVTYKRGQTISIIWPRNNHRGGMVRFTLVPRDLRMNASAHDRLAFRYACFDSDPFKCPLKNCGTDVRNIVYKTLVEIPTIYPDGEYTLGWAWYGGVRWNTDESLFGDYWSCTDVIIRGGPKKESYQPVFFPGERVPNVSGVRPPSCLSSVNKLGPCKREPCNGIKAYYRVPQPFEKGASPPAITAYWKSLGGSSIVPEPRNVPKQPVSPPTKPKPRTPPQKPVSAPTSINPGRAEVVGLKLMDLDRNVVLTKRFPNTIYLPKRNSRITFVAETIGKVERVTFYLNRKPYTTEKAAPYAFYGDVGNHLRAWPKPILKHWFTVSVVATGYDNRRDTDHFTVRLMCRGC